MKRMLYRVGAGFMHTRLWTVILRAGTVGPKDLYRSQDEFLSAFMKA